MGINYSLSLITRRDIAGLLLDCLREVLDSRSADRIPVGKWAPESECRRTTATGTTDLDARGIAGIQVADAERSNSYCFSLQLQLEPEQEALLQDHGFEYFQRPGSFGCMWTSVFAGEEYLLLEMTAATSAMSRVLQRSTAIHDLWARLAKNAQALIAYIDMEEQVAIQLYPAASNIELPDFESITFEDDYRFSVDRMATFLLASRNR